MRFIAKERHSNMGAVSGVEYQSKYSPLEIEWRFRE
jgi:hypothetical protein